jgi:hypothetical protein
MTNLKYKYIFDCSLLHTYKIINIFNPYPGGLVANVISKTLSCLIKFIVHKKIEQNL